MFDFYKYRCDISTNDALKCFRSPSIFPLKIYFQDLSSWQYQVLLLAAFFASCSGWSLQWVLFFLHQHNLNHHYHFCNNDDNDDDQGWPLQSTVCRLELNKKSVRAWILHLLLAGDHHDEDDQDEVDRDEEDDEDDEDYDDATMVMVMTMMVLIMKMKMMTMAMMITMVMTAFVIVIVIITTVSSHFLAFFTSILQHISSRILYLFKQILVPIRCCRNGLRNTKMLSSPEVQDLIRY